MSVFGNIMSSIFGGAAAAKPVAAQPPSPMDAQAPTAPPRQVDVAAIMDQLAGSSREELDWRKSIVDLLKLLKLDSSLAARKQLAEELHYPGSMKDSAAMNVWLHKQVMLKLAENGGKVPAELKH